jgi:hypothetical protein
VGKVDDTYSGGSNVGEVGSNTGGVDNIVEGELINERRSLQEEGEGLADSASSTENSWGRG